MRCLNLPESRSCNPTFLLVLLFGISCVTVYGQRKFQQGYIETNDHQIVHGQLLLISANSYFSCVFKESGTVLEKTFGPTDIRAYGYKSGRNFVSMSFRIGADSIHAFAERLFNGRISLIEAFKHLYLVKDTVTTEITDERGLSAILGDCDQVKNQLNESRSQNTSFKELVLSVLKGYSGCEGKEKPEVNSIYFQMAPMAGITFGNTSVHDASPAIASVTSKSYFNQSHLAFGIHIKVGFINSPKLKITTGLLYLPNSFHSSTANGPDFSEWTFDSKSLLVPLSLEYKFLQRRTWTSYARISVAYGIVLSQNSTILIDTGYGKNIYSNAYTLTSNSSAFYEMLTLGVTRKVGAIRYFTEFNLAIGQYHAKVSDPDNDTAKLKMVTQQFLVGIIINNGTK